MIGMVRTISLKESELFGLVKCAILEAIEVPSKERVVEYVKGFGKKGKLSSCDNPISDYYKPFIKQAYEALKKDEPNSDIVMGGEAYFKHCMGVNFLNKLTFNKRGLIYVERQIELGNNLDGLSFKSVGECWSFKRHYGSAYASNYSIMDRYNKTVVVTLCGYVHPDSVNWLSTCYVNGWELNNEAEIRMSDNAVVEVGYILINGVRHNLGGSYLLNASADKYSDKW